MKQAVVTENLFLFSCLSHIWKNMLSSYIRHSVKGDYCHWQLLSDREEVSVTENLLWMCSINF